MKLNFEQYGNGKPIVFLHAFPFSGQMWRRQSQELASSGWRVVLPDLPGFGKSPISAEISGIDAMARAVNELLNALEIERAAIAGLSMGGYAALNFFKFYPEKVSALILADTTAQADSEEKRKSRYEMIEKIAEQGSEILVSEMLPKMISQNTKDNNPALVREIAEMIANAEPQAMIAALKGMAGRDDFSDILAEIDVSTQLIFGEEDKITDLAAAEHLKTGIKNSKLAVIPSAGHLSNLENPTKFNQILLAFLSDI